MEPQLPSGAGTIDNGEKPALPAFEVKSSGIERNAAQSEDGISAKAETDTSGNKSSDAELAQAKSPLLDQNDPLKMPTLPTLPTLPTQPALGELPKQINPPESKEETSGTVNLKSDEMEKPDKTETSENIQSVSQQIQSTESEIASKPLTGPNPEGRSLNDVINSVAEELEDNSDNQIPISEVCDATGETHGEILARTSFGKALAKQQEEDIPIAKDVLADPSNGDPHPEPQEEIEVEPPVQLEATRREPVVDQGFLAYMESLDDESRVKLLGLPQIIARWIASADGEVGIHESLVIHKILKEGAYEIDKEFQDLKWKNQEEINNWIESVLPEDLPHTLRVQFDVLLKPLDEYRKLFETMSEELREKFGNFVYDTCIKVSEASGGENGIAGKIGLEEKFVIQLICESLEINVPGHQENEE